MKDIIKNGGGIKEFIVPFVFGLWLLYQFIDSFSLKISDFDSLGSNGYARMVSGVGLILIIAYLIQRIVIGIRVTKQQSAVTPAVNAENHSGEKDNTENTKSEINTEQKGFIGFCRTHYEISMLILCIAYVFLIARIGFVISSALYLFISMMLYSRKGERNIIVIVILTAVFSVGMYYIFRYGFKIILP